MPQWMVPYESEDKTLIRYVIATVMSLAGLLPLCGFGLADSHPVGGWIAVATFVAGFETMLWRVALVGVYVGERGVKVRSVVRTRLVRWPDFEHARVAQASFWDAWAIWISVRDAGTTRDIETPIWRRGTNAAHKNRIKLDPAEFSRLIDRLNTEAARRRPETREC